VTIKKLPTAFKPIPIVSHVSEETIIETYSQIKDDIAELFKAELAMLDKGKEPCTSEATLEVYIPKALSKNATPTNEQEKPSKRTGKYAKNQTNR